MTGALLVALVLGGMSTGADGAESVHTAVQAPRTHAPRTQAADTGQVVLNGQIRMEAYRGGPGLPGAIVEVRQSGALHTTVADDRGRYRIPGLGGGEAALQVRHLAAEPHLTSLLLPGRGSVTVDVELERRTLALPPVEVFARAIRPLNPRPAASLAPTGTAHPRIRLAALESTSGLVESGLARSGRLEPPGEGDRPPEQALFMRGSTVDSRMVLLDGAPVLTPFHLAGLVPSFDARSLHGASVYLGGAPARFEGGLSYVLDAETRAADPDEPTVEVALDGLAVRGGLNLAAGDRAGLIATGRAFHGAQAAFTPSSEVPYRFQDLLVRGDLSLGAAGDLHATFFRNREGVVLDSDGSMGRGTIFGNEETSWGNRAVAANWRAELRRTRIEAVAATARYRASLPVIWDDPVLARTTTDRHRGEVRATRPHGEGVLQVGVSFERQALAYRLDAAQGAAPESVATERLAEEPSRIEGDRVGLFAEAELPFRERVTLRAGGRIDHFSQAGGVHLSPRARLVMELNDDARFTLSAGRFHQYMAEPGLLEDGTTGTVSTLRWSAGLDVASATHLVMELDQDFSRELSLGVSGFIKHFEGGLGGSRGRINSSGTDLRLARAGDRLDAWVGYALSWYWEPGAGRSVGSGAADFSGRHLLTTGARYRDPSGFQVGASIEYGAGLPLTEVPLAQPEGDGSVQGVRPLSGGGGVDRLAGSGPDNPLDLIREDDFLRVDLEASWVTHPIVGGRETELRPYVRVLNALDRRDALFYYFDRWRDSEVRPLAERPLLPLMGLEWRF